MKKRILSVLLSFALLAAMLPTAALAADSGSTDQTYTVTLMETGTLSKGAGDYHEGDLVELCPGRRVGESFAGWTVTEGDVTIDNPTSYSGASFTMPAHNVTLTATWVPQYEVKVNDSAVKFNSAEPTNGAGFYPAGSTVEIFAGSKPDDTFKCWVVDSGDVTIDDPSKANGATFTMPANEVRIVARWSNQPFLTVNGEGTLVPNKYSGTGNHEPYEPYDPNDPDKGYVLLNAGTREGYRFVKWVVETNNLTIRNNYTSIGINMPNEDTVVTAIWAPNGQYNVTVNGSYATTSGEGNYAPDAMVNLDAGTREGYTFNGWKVSPTTVALTDASSAQTTFPMPAKDVTVTASWKEDTSTTYAVTVNDSYATASGAANYAQGATVSLDAGTQEGYTFSGWTVTSGTVTLANPNSAQTTFIMPAGDVTVTANWTQNRHSLTIQGLPGGDKTETHTAGEQVTLDAGTREGYAFAGWMVTSGTVTLADASSARTTFIMPAGDVTVTANWTQNRHTLTIKGLPGGDRTETHAAGESVTVSAGTKAGYTFAGWTSNPVFLYTGTPDATFSMPGYDLTVLAVWTPEPDADGAVTLYLDELPGPLTIDAQGYCCGEPGNFQHSFTGPYILTQRDPGTATANTVTVSKDGGKSEFAITLKGVNIASADQAALLVNDDAKLTLTLQGGNTLKGGANHAGLELKATARIPETAVVINGTARDSLTAAGGDNGAGIGGSASVGYGTVTINGGVITATGGKGAAGIGSGNTYASGGAGSGGDGTVIINDGTIIAVGTNGDGPSGALLGAAGIGAGYGKASYPDDGPYSIITVTGGDVTATGVGKAPAIGGTYTGIITISGGTVTTHRGDNQSTAEIGKHPDASGGICQVRLSDWQGTKVGSAQIFVSGPNAISDKPASPTGTDNYYWNAIVYEGDSGQLYCSYYNSTQAMELDALTVPAGKTLSIPRGVELKLPQDGLHWDGASFAGEGRVVLGETYHYAKADGKLTPCEAAFKEGGDDIPRVIFNTLHGLLTAKMAEGTDMSWLIYDDNHITLLADVDYPAEIDLTGTQCTELEIDLNGKTLNMGNHAILADVEHSTVAENNVFTISDSSAEGSGKIVGSSGNPLVRNTTGRLVITGGALENSGAGPAVQIENVWPALKLSGGSFSRLAVVANAGFTPTPLVELLAEGCAFRGTEDQVWVSPASKRAELSSVSIQAAPAGLLPLAAVHGAGSNEVSVSGLESASASYQWAARSYEGGGSAALPGATGPILYLNDGTLEEGYYYVSCQVTVNGLTIATDEVYAEAAEPAVTLTVAEGTYVYSGTAHRPAVTVTAKDGTVLTEGTDYTLTYEDNVNAGAARVVVQGTEAHPFDTVRKSFQIDRAPLSVQAKDQTVQQGADIQSGSSMAAAEGLVPGDTLTDVVLAKSGDNTQISPSDARVQNAAGQDVTGNYEITYRPGALTVTGGGGGGSSGGGSSGGNTTQNPDGSTTTIQTNPGAGTVTETTKRPDGSTTVVETRRDGTVTTTETDPDGGRTETVERPDGSASITTQTRDGTTARTSVTPSGQVESSVSLSQEALTAAQADGGAVSLPLPSVQAQTELAQAAAVTIQAPAEGPVKVEIPVSNATQGTVAVLVREDGTTEILKRTVPGEAGISFEVESGATVKIVDNSKRFDDVEQTSWAAPCVEFAAARELFTGVSETSFGPEQPMTRGMVMTVLARLDGQDTAGGSTWYEPGLSWAQSNGISDGTQPMSNVSREQLVLMLYRYAGSPETADTLLSFPDSGQISAYARDAMCWAVSNGILHGTGSGLLDPQGPATRAQVAQIFENYIRMP